MFYCYIIVYTDGDNMLIFLLIEGIPIYYIVIKKLRTIVRVKFIS